MPLARTSVQHWLLGGTEQVGQDLDLLSQDLRRVQIFVSTAGVVAGPGDLSTPGHQPWGGPFGVAEVTVQFRRLPMQNA